MGDKGSQGPDYAGMAYQNAFNAAQQGMPWGAVEQSFVGPDAQYYDYGVAGYQAGMPQPDPFAGLMELFAGMGESSGDTNIADVIAQQNAEAEQTTALSRIDTLYGTKFAAANEAVDRVNSLISEEAGSARVSGADYNISEGEKAERINNMFANLWTAEQEGQLSGLEGEWGSSGNKWTSGIVRGVSSDDATDDGEEGAQAGSGVSPQTVFSMFDDEEEDDKLGGVNQVLGG